MAAVDVAQRFGKNLARERRKKKLTQEQVADLGQVHRTLVSQIEAGNRQPRLETLIKLAGALNVQPSALLDGISWEPPKQAKGRFRITAD
jgi:transcriptional regulator with XRE-family HTH domain